MLRRGSTGPRRWAREADVHLAIRPGTNQALMNAILREVIEHGWFDPAYVEAHTLGFEQLGARRRGPTTSERAAGICRHPRS